MPKPTKTTTTYELPGGVSLSLTLDESRALESVQLSPEVDADTHRADVCWSDDSLAEVMSVFDEARKAWRRRNT